MNEYKVDVIIPVYKPDEKFEKLMKMLKRQSYPANRIILMNTEKQFFPQAGYEEMPGVEVVHLTRAEFDHGGTRDRAAALCNGDFLLFMTQDAVALDEYLIEHLVAAFSDERVAAAYARQLPADDCAIIERYTRSFNYPEQSSVKRKEDLPLYGIKTFFCSNVCAMYRRDIYQKMGGFEKHTIFNEDMIFAGKLIQQGYTIAYAADAKVIHSHNYGNIEQFKRNFDLAVSQAEHPEVFSMAKSESEGMKLVKSTAVYLMKIGKPWLVLSLVVKSGFKFLGYRAGKSYRKLPKWMILKFTMNRAYWEK